MSSTRLPRKVLKDLAGAPMLIQQLRRLARCTTLDEITVATSTATGDDPVVETTEREGFRWFRGSETDVLARYVGAAQEARADVVVRSTADCPLIDPGTVDRVVGSLTPQWDYASNVVERSFPAGLDVEALHLDTLVRTDRLATSAAAREHVTWFILREHPELYRIRSVVDEENNSDLRWTVDEEADLELVRRIYGALDLARVIRPYSEVIAYVRADASLVPTSKAAPAP